VEDHSTRARANLLRAVVSGDLSPNALSSAQAREVMETCVGCKACKTECPARVDMARLTVAWRDLIRRREGASSFARAIANLRVLARAGSYAPELANRVLASRAFKKRLGIAAERSLPPVAGTPLTRRMRAGRAPAILYPDCFTTYFEPSVGTAAVELVAAARQTMARARAGCCGRVMLSEGFVDKARRTARRSARALRRTKGPILFCEPSCMSAVTDDWPHLIGDVADIAGRCVLAEEHIAAIGGKLRFEGGGRVLLHGHCHQKALWGTSGTQAALSLIPDLRVDTLDAGCCGMAGAFGYRAERQELSRAMAERVLLPSVRADPEAVVIATGTSCRHQIADLGPRAAIHPLVFLRERLR
jgi:Fe-S oxidoreductase